MTRHYSATAQPTTLTGSVTDSATVIQVAATTGFPATDFVLALDFEGVAQELVLVTGVAGLNLTVTRGFNGTTAVAHNNGASVVHVHSAQDFTDSRTHEAATSGVHGRTGSLVGTSDSQTLTHKDLTDATNTFPSLLATDAEVTAAVATAAATAASNLSAHEADTTTHGTTGNIVGDTDTQTLTNKTLTAPVVNDPVLGGDYIGAIQYVVKGSDEGPLANSSTYQDDDTLFVTVTANAVYQMEFAYLFTGTVNTGGLKAQWAAPTGTQMALSSRNPTAAVSPKDYANTPYGIEISPPGSSDYFSSPHQTIATYRVKVGGTGGTLKVQWAQYTAHATGITGKVDSYIILRRIA